MFLLGCQTQYFQRVHPVVKESYMYFRFSGNTFRVSCGCYHYVLLLQKSPSFANNLLQIVATSNLLLSNLRPFTTHLVDGKWDLR